MAKKLQFYKKPLPVRLIKMVISFLLAFCISSIVCFFYINREEEKSAQTMGNPSLPLITMEVMGQGNTVLHGYVQQMDACYMRDAIVPISDERYVSFDVDVLDNDIKEISYEVRSLNTSRKISGNKLDFSESNNHISSSFQIENLIEEGEEYLLIMNLSLKDKDVYYYTRIMQPDKNCNTKECLDFVWDFHNKQFSDDYEELALYLEPKDYTNKNTLNNVTINSSLTQVAFGEFKGQQIGEPSVSITDTTPTFTTIVLNYQMTVQKGRYNDYFNVEEYYRVRYGTKRMYLLDYKRTMEQILTDKGITVENNKLNIGIRSEDVQYMSNETGTVAGFVQAGELYLYNQNEKVLSRVFSFLGDNPKDKRGTYGEHKIIVMNIDESGTMDYVVYGYMNSGAHEGCCGINLYHYDSVSKESIEQVFIPTTGSYQILNANFSQLLYETANEEFYIMVNGTLVKLHMDSMESEEIMSGLSESQYAVSASGRYIAWSERDVPEESLYVLDLETSKVFTIKAGADSLVKPLDFIENDLVYGTIYKSNITTDGAGTTHYPMHKLTIADISTGKETVKKNYRKDGVYVIDLKIDGYTIYLNRVTLSDEQKMVAASGDTIKNAGGETNKAIPIEKIQEEQRGEVIVMKMASLPDSQQIERISIKNRGIVATNSTRNIEVSSKATSDQYFVYVGNRVEKATDDLIEAIQVADDNQGIVLNDEQQYVWKRGRKNYSNAFSNMSVGSFDENSTSRGKAISAMLVKEGENVQVQNLLDVGLTPLQILQRTLKTYKILDLTGASLSQVLYYVNIGNPVYVRTADDDARLIIGYDAASIIVYNPNTNVRNRMSMNDAEKLFTEQGSVYISYLK